MTRYSPTSTEGIRLKNTSPEIQAKRLQNSPAYTEAKKTNEKFNAILMQNRIIEEISKAGIPDLELIFSPEYMRHIPGVLDKLFEGYLEEYRRCVDTPKEKITFDILNGTDDIMSFKFNYFWHLINQYNSSNDTASLRKIFKEFQPRLSALYNESMYSKKEYVLYRHCLDNCELDAEQKKIISKSVRDYEKRGIHLPDDKVARLKEINTRMTKLETRFVNNVLDDEKEFEYIIENKAVISEMPEDVLDKARNNAIEAGKSGYMFSINQSDLNNILVYCSDSGIRKHFYNAGNSIASKGKRDNRGICLKMLKMREEKVSILGYGTYSECILQDQMAGNPKKVIDVLEEGISRALAKEKKEIGMLKDHFGLKEIDIWDISYYSRLYALEKFDLDSKITRRYYEFDTVLEGLRSIAKKLFGIELKESDQKPYREGIRYFEVYKDNELKGYYILDPYARKNKTSGAWNSKVRYKQRDKDGQTIYPLVFNVASFFEVSKGKSLIGSNGARTLFHEFGHMLHGLCGKSAYPNLVGTASMEKDFVELFSTFMENYKNEDESLKTFARDFETGEVIPDDILRKYEETKKLMSGTSALRSFNFALIDIRIHNEKCPATVKQLDEKAFRIAQGNTNFRLDEDSYKILASFKHLFYWSYASFYYSYIWADIISTQVFGRFKKNGIFNKDIADEYYDKLLSQGSIKSAMEQFRDFTGEDINLEAFFEELGI